MRFRKRPKIVEAVPVSNILAGDRHPYWLTRAVKAGKVHITQHKVLVVTANQAKNVDNNGWIAHDIVQDMVYGVSRRTMEADYEQIESSLPLQGEF